MTEIAFAPDGRSIAYFAGGKLYRIRVDGDTPLLLADAPAPRGVSWGQDHTIVFSPVSGGPLRRVSARGGSTAILGAAGGGKDDSGPRYPHALPDGRHFLFSDWGGIWVGSMDGGDDRHLTQADGLPGRTGGSKR